MFEIIAAAVYVIGSAVAGALGAQTGLLAAQKAAEQENIDYEHAKSLGYLNIAIQREKERNMLIGSLTIGVVLFIIILVVVRPKSGK